MFGRPLEIMIDKTFVVSLTNEDLSLYFNYLPRNQWCYYNIHDDILLKIRKTFDFSLHYLNSHYIKLNGKEKKRFNQ